jgi:putative endonuclease
VVYVYLLRCADDSLYCGWTTDLQRRLTAHHCGGASRYTRSRRPLQLALVIPVPDRSAALRAEARIKRLPRAAKLRLIGAAWDPGGQPSRTDSAPLPRGEPLSAG